MRSWSDLIWLGSFKMASSGFIAILISDKKTICAKFAEGFLAGANKMYEIQLNHFTCTLIGQIQIQNGTGWWPYLDATILIMYITVNEI